MGYKFDLVLPWDIKRLKADSRLRWPISFLRDREFPVFIYEAPTPKMIERVSVLTEQLCAKRRRCVVCFGNNTDYNYKLFCYVTASFVLTTGISAEITTPKKLMDFAFNFGGGNQFECSLHSFEVCGLLTIPWFDFMYPGYQKARPKIAECLASRKAQKKSCMIEVYVPKNLPNSFEGLASYAPVLMDFVGTQAKDLFGGKETKFIIIEAEK